MGAGIAAAFSTRACPSSSVDATKPPWSAARAKRGEDLRGRGLARAHNKRGRARRRARRLCASPDNGGKRSRGEDVIVEAVFGGLRVKREVFAALDAVAKPGALLATNTSYIDPGAIADATKRPESVVGLHFFSPANVMKLLEVVRPPAASDAAIATAWAVAKTIGKTPVLAGVCEGFIGNRILKVYRRASEALLLDGGWSPEAVDAAMRGSAWRWARARCRTSPAHDNSGAMRKPRAELRRDGCTPRLRRLGGGGASAARPDAGLVRHPEGARGPKPSGAARPSCRGSGAAGRTPRRASTRTYPRRSSTHGREGRRAEEGIALRAASLSTSRGARLRLSLRTSGGLLSGRRTGRSRSPALEADALFRARRPAAKRRRLARSRLMSGWRPPWNTPPPKPTFCCTVYGLLTSLRGGRRAHSEGGKVGKGAEDSSSGQRAGDVAPLRRSHVGLPAATSLWRA